MTDIQADILLKRRGSGAADAFDLGVAASARQTTRRPSDYGRVSDIGKGQLLAPSAASRGQANGGAAAEAKDR